MRELNTTGSLRKWGKHNAEHPELEGLARFLGQN